MMQSNKYPPIVVLSATTEGEVQCMSIDGIPLPLLDHGKDLACIFVPGLLVEQQLAYKDYVLYLFKNENDLGNNISKLQQQEENVILLIGDDEDRKIYFIEDKELVSSTPIPVLCRYYLKVINQFILNPEGKVIGAAEPDNITNIINFLRFMGSRGNEVGIGKTMAGSNLFSRYFSPCNALVARTNKDNLFVVNHALSASVERYEEGDGLFLKIIDEGNGSNFTAVMQNSNNKKNYLKAPRIAAGLAVELKDQNVSRINFPEGYHAIACVNNNTIIMSLEMEFFRNVTEKERFLQQFALKNLGEARILDLDNECLPLSKTAEELVNQYNIEDRTMKVVYSSLLGRLGIFNLEEAKIPESEKTCCFLM